MPPDEETHGRRMLAIDERLRANRDFRRAYSRGRSFVHDLMVLYVLRRQGDDCRTISGRRIGFVVSKKQGGAVVRNRIKRRMREAVRQRIDELPSGPFDLVFVGRARLKAATWPSVESAVAELARRSAGSRRSQSGGAARSDRAEAKVSAVGAREGTEAAGDG